MKTSLRIGFVVLLLFSCTNEQQAKSFSNMEFLKVPINAKTMFSWNPSQDIQCITEGGDTIAFVKMYGIDDFQIFLRTYCAKCDVDKKKEGIKKLSFYKTLTIEQREFYDTIYSDTVAISGYQAIQYYTNNTLGDNFYELLMEDIAGEGYYLSILGLHIDPTLVESLKNEVKTLKIKIE